jgi:hypothetical protein
MFKLTKILNIINEFSFYFFPIFTPLLSILFLKKESELDEEKEARNNAIQTLYFQLLTYLGLFSAGFIIGIGSALITLIAESATTTIMIGTWAISAFILPNLLIVIASLAILFLTTYPAIRGIKAITKM